jgi:hypothetical protein
MANEGIFRFTALRAAKEKLRRPATKTRFPLYTPTTETPFYLSFVNAKKGGATRAALTALAEQFKTSGHYVREVALLPLELIPLLRWAAKNANEPITGITFADEFKTLYGKKLSDLAATNEWKSSYNALADTILADALSGRREEHIEDVTLSFKLLTLGDRTAKGDEVPFEGTLGDFVAKVTIVVPQILGPFETRPTTEPTTTPVPVPTESETTVAMRERLAAVAEAHRELSALIVAGSTVEAPTTEKPPRARATSGTGGETSGGHPLIDAGNDLFFTKEAIGRLSEATIKLLAELHFSRDYLEPFRAVAALEAEMHHLGAQLASLLAPRSILLLGGVTLDKTKLQQSLGFGASLPAAKGMPSGPKAGCGFGVGIGDLLMVQQKLKAYEVAEFAHVENVLAGETRERDHRRLNLREEIQITTTESETEREKDLQTTERNELQNEASKTVKDSMALEAGLQVNGSYGPTISFSASMKASYSSSVEETQKKAASYSHEVTERTAERTRELVRTERRVRVLEEIEEINKHRFENTSPKHIRGVYRWLNKIYDAQVFNYGKRMMYEFVIPEPAAYFLYAMIENPPKDLEVKKPDPPEYNGMPLKPSNLGRTNYLDYVAQYQVPNVPPPPPEFQVVAYFDKQDGGEKVGHFGRSGKVEIPDGYAAVGATVHSGYNYEEDGQNFTILLGGKLYDGSNAWLHLWKDFNPRWKELSIAYTLFHAFSFALGVDVFCKIQPEGFAKWQHTVYDAVINAYLQQKADYEDALKQAKLAEQPQEFGRNPLENRRMERDELKKLAIEMLIANPFLNINSFQGGNEPVMNLDAACKNGSFIRFFENAFEWNNILYVMYPYFWARHAKWVSALHLTDVDPDFAAFLKAGAARVQVPVRPGFERAVAHYCQFGEIWDGHDAPLMDDELYVPIVDEITESLGKPHDPPVPYPEGSEPWEVTVPTELVILENLEEVPHLRDIMTGQDITVIS